jgi:trimeric autotransporter adhesin
MKNILSITSFIVLLAISISDAQDITNTLAPDGSFKIKDSSTDYLFINQATGNLNLLKNLELGGIINSTSTAGVITKNGQPFIHNYKPDNCDGLNTFIGINSGNFTMGGINSYNGSFNSAVGNNTLSLNTTGFSNSAFGESSLSFNTTGSGNSAFGSGSLLSNTTGNNNSSFGASSLVNNTTGNSNSAFGVRSLVDNTVGNGNSAFGVTSLNVNSSGSYNSAFGFGSLNLNLDGYYNSAFGQGALLNQTSGYENSGFGYRTLYLNVASFNSAFGSRSMENNTSGQGNTALGIGSLLNNTTGSNNTAIGNVSGNLITTGNNNIAIGYGSEVPSGIGSNQVRIGNSVITYAGIQVAWTITSDRRWKENIQPTNLGLDFITKLNPVSYTRKNDENQKTEYGLIAQEIEQVLKEEGIENTGMLTVTDEGYYELRYNDLLAPMIRAIQELKIERDKEIAELKIQNEKLEIEKDEEVAALKIKNTSLEERLSKYEEFQTMLVKEIEQIKSNQQNYKVQIVNADKIIQ